MSKRLTSFDQLARQMGRRTAPQGRVGPPPGPEGSGPLRVGFELAGDAGPPVVHECRSVVLGWVQEIVDIRLPRKAWRMRPFSAKGKDGACRAARLRDARRDSWAVRVERAPGSGKEIVTEIVVASSEGQAPRVTVTLHDRSVVPADLAAEYPAGMLAELDEVVPLFQAGRRVAHTPMLVDSDAAMNVFLRTLMDPERPLPAAVVSIAPEDDREVVRPQWETLARSLTGLAVTWVLPQRMTFRLSDTVGKPLSVFLGAWRFYRAGFGRQAGQHQHPLVLKRRMEDERGVNDVIRRFVRMAAEERMHFDQEAEAGGAGAPDSAAGAAPPPKALDYEAVARQSGGGGWGPSRLFGFLRDSILGGRTREPAPVYDAGGVGGDAAGAAGAGVDAVAAPPPSLEPVSRPSAPSAGPTPAATVTSPAPTPPGPAAPPAAPPPASAPSPVAIGDARMARKLQQVREKAARRLDKVERERGRAKKAEGENEALRKRVEQLEELVRTLGGNPDVEVPFPTAWSEFPVWCEKRLAGKVVLAGSAVREIGSAQFRDVALAARCLLWLGGDYRSGRMKGGNPRLRGRIDSIGDGIYNAPCGGDSFDHTWEGRTLRVDWHIKSGANTRDPKRCLRIYYFWDDQKKQVVVVLMPAHRKTGMS